MDRSKVESIDRVDRQWMWGLIVTLNAAAPNSDMRIFILSIKGRSTFVRPQDPVQFANKVNATKNSGILVMVTVAMLLSNVRFRTKISN
jgi:hypothetical protein